jgi:hypothetical protein
VRHLLAGYDVSRDKLYGHVTTRKAELSKIMSTREAGKCR